LAGVQPDYNTNDLYQSIANGKFPEWTVYIQVMTLEQAQTFEYNVLDATKIWPHRAFPLIEIGKLVLNKNPVNYFAEIEQLAFAPSTLIPGIAPSPDPILQTRLFVYPDTQVYRLGVNMQQLPANRPICPIANFQRNGFMAFDNQGSQPDYRSSLHPPNLLKPPYPPSHQEFIGVALHYLSHLTLLDFEQPRRLWRIWSPGEQNRFIENIVAGMTPIVSPIIKYNQLVVFATVDEGLAKRIAAGLGLLNLGI